MADSPYRNKHIVRELTGAINEAAADLPPVKIMHVCGTHEHELGRHALRQLLPENIALIAGPGCPVCITPAAAIATAIKLALHESHPILCTYGDMVRVPIADGHLLGARGRGADVRIIYGPREALRIAKENPDRNVVFFSIGFETTAAAVASILLRPLPDNLLLYTSHRYVPAAVEAIAGMEDSEIDGYLLPGHASVITGSVAYRYLPERFGLAAAVAGFEPVDILAGVLSLARQLKEDKPDVVNCYPRAVKDEGNLKAQEAMHKAFVVADGDWRGIGTLPGTALVPNERYARHDALARLGIDEQPAEDIMPGCSCHLIMLGRRQPSDCALFRKVCTPENPQGPCMVGGEGTCRAHYLYPEGEDV